MQAEVLLYLLMLKYNNSNTDEFFHLRFEVSLKHKILANPPILYETRSFTNSSNRTNLRKRKTFLAP